MKTITIAITIVFFSIATALTAQDGKKNEQIKGSGIIKSEKRDVEKFNVVTVAGSPDANITIGEKTEVVVKTDDNILPFITTEVKDNELVISTKAHVSLESKEIKVYITTPNLSGVKVNGSGDISVHKLDGNEFNASIDGSGDITAKGNVKKLKCRIKGSGDLDLDDLEAKDVIVSIVGSGDANVNATESLQAKVVGSGDITYKNKANLKIVKHIIGSGDICKSKKSETTSL